MTPRTIRWPSGHESGPWTEDDLARLVAIGALDPEAVAAVMAKGKHGDLPLVPSKKNPKVRRRMRLEGPRVAHPRESKVTVGQLVAAVERARRRWPDEPNAARMEILMLPPVYRVWQRMNPDHHVERVSNAKYGPGFILYRSFKDVKLHWNSVRDDYYAHAPGNAWNGVWRETKHMFIDDLNTVAWQAVQGKPIDPVRADSSDSFLNAMRAGLRLVGTRELPEGIAVGDVYERPSGEHVTVIGREDADLIVRMADGKRGRLGIAAVTSGRAEKVEPMAKAKGDRQGLPLVPSKKNPKVRRRQRLTVGTLPVKAPPPPPVYYRMQPKGKPLHGWTSETSDEGVVPPGHVFAYTDAIHVVSDEFDSGAQDITDWDVIEFTGTHAHDPGDVEGVTVQPVRELRRLPLRDWLAWQAQHYDDPGERGAFQEAHDDLVPPPSPEQAFARWFGASKVVDAVGKPQVVYHGTTRGGFAEFETPSFFTPDPEDADYFHTHHFYTDGSEAPQTFPVYLRIENPFDLRTREGCFKMFDVLREVGFPFELEEDQYGWRFNSKRITEVSGYMGENVNDLVYVPEVRAALQARGFDGIVAWDALTNYEILVYVPFEPTQIKSAIANVGTYSPTDSDIAKATEEPMRKLVFTGRVRRAHRLLMKSPPPPPQKARPGGAAAGPAGAAAAAPPPPTTPMRPPGSAAPPPPTGGGEAPTLRAEDIDHDALGGHLATFKPVLVKGRTLLEGYFPGVPVAGRLKETKALAGQLAKTGSVDGDEVKDICGLRIEFPTEAEQRRAVKRIKGKLSVTAEQDYLTHPNRGVYRAYHLVLDIDGQPAELQVRTPGQTAWADWTHSTIVMEHDGTPPPEVAAYAKAMSAYVRAIDNQQDPGEVPECPDAVLARYGEMVIPGGDDAAGH